MSGADSGRILPNSLMPGLAPALWANRGRAAAYGALAGCFTLLAIGIPTALIPSGVFGRSVPPGAWNYLFLIVTVLLACLLGAAYALPASCPLQEGKLAAGGMLSFMAVGCPVCNKIVVLLVGASGALSYFQPIQLLLGALSVALLGFSLLTRLRAITATSPL